MIVEWILHKHIPPAAFAVRKTFLVCVEACVRGRKRMQVVGRAALEPSSIVWATFPPAVLNTRIEPSELPEAMNLPSGEKRTASTSPSSSCWIVILGTSLKSDSLSSEGGSRDASSNEAMLILMLLMLLFLRSLL